MENHKIKEEEKEKTAHGDTKQEHSSGVVYRAYVPSFLDIYFLVGLLRVHLFSNIFDFLFGHFEHFNGYSWGSYWSQHSVLLNYEFILMLWTFV